MLYMYNLKIKKNSVTLVDLVEDKLLNYFKENHMKPGDSIPKEGDLAEALGVGRSVLREALSRFRMLGMIESRTRRGMMLTEPHILKGLERVIDPLILGEETLFNLLGFRVALEIGICNNIIENINNKFIEELELIVNEGVVYENNLYLPISEHKFHSKLYEITGNKTIMQFQEIIYPVSLFVKDKFFDFLEPINKELKVKGTIVTHRDLLQYIKSRDKDGFREAVEMHFRPYYMILMRNRLIKNTDAQL
jgi:GntR family transcriptional regulator, transcriptional repressor for pyruvate dehydrogenase complex